MKHLLIALAALPLAACQFIPGQPEYIIAQAQQQAARLMRDPDSTKFRSSKMLRTIHDGTEHFAICGEINATDQGGEYAGFRRFFYSDGKASVNPQINTAMALDYANRCLEARIRDASVGPYGQGLGERVRCTRMAEAETDLQWQEDFDRDWAHNCGGYLMVEPVGAPVEAIPLE